MKRLTLAEVAAGGLLDPRRRARQAQLRYVSDCLPGIRRRRAGRGFVYIDPQGKRVTNRDERARIAALAIPPAWTDVWICPLENGHLQATGRDDRGRKQYRYHDRWHEMSNVTKFQKLEKFGLALPRIRAAVERELASRKLTKEKVVATVVHLLDQTGLRVGNEEYVRSNDSYGIATLRDEHLEVDGHTSRIRFRGKGGKYFEVELRDRRLARILSECQEIPGQEALSVRRRGWRIPPGAVGRCEPISAAHHAATVHGEGLPHLERHLADRRAAYRARGVHIQARDSSGAR